MDCCQLPAEGILTGVETGKLFCWYGDDCGAFANLLYYLNSHIVPRACCFYRNGVEDVCVCACQLGVLGVIPLLLSAPTT